GRGTRGPRLSWRRVRLCSEACGWTRTDQSDPNGDDGSCLHIPYNRPKRRVSDAPGPGWRGYARPDDPPARGSSTHRGGQDDEGNRCDPRNLQPNGRDT